MTACRTLEKEEHFQSKVRFSTDEAELTLLDRLQASNNGSEFETVRDQITPFLSTLYESGSVGIERDAEDDRRCLTMRIVAPGAPDLDTLIEQLAENPAA